ncbi:MAG: WG repeat-containing protein [Alistipes putredinis]|nr:MAG: WG repeat-containing protein [Alistipes putredinis]
MLDTALRFFAEEADARNYRLCKLLASPTPYIENIEEFFADPRPCRQKLHPFQRNGLWGYADENGRIAIAPWWDEAFDFRGSAAVVRLEDKYHCIDECGRTIINGKRWDCMKLQGEGYAAVKSEGKWGIYRSRRRPARHRNQIRQSGPRQGRQSRSDGRREDRFYRIFGPVDCFFIPKKRYF